MFWRKEGRDVLWDFRPSLEGGGDNLWVKGARMEVERDEWKQVNPLSSRQRANESHLGIKHLWWGQVQAIWTGSDSWTTTLPTRGSCPDSRITAHDLNLTIFDLIAQLKRLHSHSIWQSPHLFYLIVFIITWYLHIHWFAFVCLFSSTKKTSSRRVDTSVCLILSPASLEQCQAQYPKE